MELFARLNSLRESSLISEYALVCLIIVAITVIVFAPVALRKFGSSSAGPNGNTFWVNTIRGFFAICLLIVATLHPESPVNAASPGFVRFLSVLFAAYLYYVLFFTVSYFIRRQFGRAHSHQGSNTVVDTYRSRSLTLSARIVLTAVMIIIVVHSVEADDMLRTSGMIAAFLVIIGLSQSAWAPDYISGLLILYSEMFKEGDTVKLTDSDHSFLGEIYRIKAFHTEVLSIVDNHRVIIRNSKMREYTILNMSKFASAKGLRERLLFKIGYDVPEKQVQAMFKSAFATISKDHSIPIERQHAPEIHVFETGDHAVQWSVYYFTKDTRAMLITRQLITEIILSTSKKFKVSLATPLTHYVDVSNVGNIVIGEPVSEDVEYAGSKGVTFGRNFKIPIFSS